MRIVHLAGYGGPYAGSFVPMLLAVLNEARKRGHEVEAIFRQEAEGGEWLLPLHDAGIRLRFFPVDSRAALVRSIAALTEEEPGPTVLHSHFTIFDLAVANAARNRANVVCFWHMHSRAEPGFLVRARNAVKYAAVARNVERILCVSPDIARAVRRRGGAFQSVEFFPNAIDTSRFPRIDPSERTDARRSIDAGERAVLLHFGWDWTRKGGDLFLGAARELLDRGLPVLAVTVGGGEEAVRLGRQLQLGDALLVHPPTNDLRPLHAASDVFLSPSRAEGMPFSIAEALAVGLPVVATDIPGQRVQCEGLEACRLTNFDPRGIAEAAAALLNRNMAETSLHAETARARIVERFDLGPWSQRLLDYYSAAGV